MPRRSFPSLSLSAAVRTHFGLTQAELSRFISVSRTHLAMVEAGRKDLGSIPRHRLWAGAAPAQRPGAARAHFWRKRYPARPRPATHAAAALPLLSGQNHLRAGAAAAAQRAARPATLGPGRAAGGLGPRGAPAPRLPAGHARPGG